MKKKRTRLPLNIFKYFYLKTLKKYLKKKQLKFINVNSNIHDLIMHSLIESDMIEIFVRSFFL